jgi:hypothetical protein
MNQATHERTFNDGFRERVQGAPIVTAIAVLINS